MKTLLKLLGGVVALGLIAVVALYIWARSNPSQALDMALSAERSASGLTLKFASAGGSDWPYLEGGNTAGPTLVLLHGFGADKDNWVRFARPLVDDYHVIIPDLPGFGGNTRRLDWSYDIASQVPRLHAFIETLGLSAFHLAGNSMGGNLSAAYTHAHPEQVVTLGLFCAAGVREPEPSRLTRELAAGDKNALAPRTRADYGHLMDLVFAQRPPIPDFLGYELADRAVAEADFRDKVFGEYRQRFQFLEPVLPEITAPSLVLWGDQDGLIHVSSAAVFDELLPNSELVILEGVGHAPMIEVPERSAAVYREFVESR